MREFACEHGVSEIAISLCTKRFVAADCFGYAGAPIGDLLEALALRKEANDAVTAAVAGRSRSDTS